MNLIMKSLINKTSSFLDLVFILLFVFVFFCFLDTFANNFFNGFTYIQQILFFNFHPYNLTTKRVNKICFFLKALTQMQIEQNRTLNSDKSNGISILSFAILTPIFFHKF